jgi:hypothetical protein
VAVVVAHHVIDSELIAAAEAFAIILAQFARDTRVTKLVAIVRVWAAVVLHVLAGSVHAVLKATALDLAELVGNCIPAVVIVVATIRIVIVHRRWRRSIYRLLSEVGDAYRITAAEALLIGIPHLMGHIRMAVFVAIVDVGAAVIVEVLLRAYEAILKAATLDVVEFAGRQIPVTVAIMVAVLGGAGSRRGVRGANSVGCGKSC